MTKFRKKPVVIEAVQWTGSWPAIIEWLDSLAPGGTFLVPFGGRPPITRNGIELEIATLEDGEDNRAQHVASLGDWIIRGVAGEFYPCKPDIFDATYEAV
jgi:hypothetical protein